jgi:coenzyme F420-0:L-glutamate ligase/coenzyme F420-1:gamma-L-glutamate ligase
MTLFALPGIPLVKPGDDPGGLIVEALETAGLMLESRDVVAVTSKIVSKAEGRLVRLADVYPSARARRIAARCRKDPRLVQVILDESQKVSRLRPGLIIVKHRLGFVCANAGVDRSNVQPPQPDGDPVVACGESVLLLPANPDRAAAKLRQQLGAATGVDVAVVIVDSHGRAHRMGTVGVAVGAAGLPALEDWRGRQDLFGRPLEHTAVGLADQIASAASLLMGQAAEGTPVVLVRGVPFSPREGTAADLVRPPELDLYS